MEYISAGKLHWQKIFFAKKMLFHYSANDFVAKLCYNYTKIITNKAFQKCKKKLFYKSEWRRHQLFISLFISNFNSISTDSLNFPLGFRLFLFPTDLLIYASNDPANPVCS